MRRFTEDENERLYTHLRDEAYFPKIVRYMTRGESAIIRVKGDEATLTKFKEFIGPTMIVKAKAVSYYNLRQEFGLEIEGHEEENVFHCPKPEDIGKEKIILSI